MKFHYSIDTASAKSAAHEIKGAFDWEASPEGYDYWNTVCEKLIQIATIENETTEIKSLVRDLRAVAGPIGLQHGFWELIFELESATRIDGVTDYARAAGFNSKQELIAAGKKYLAEHKDK